MNGLVKSVNKPLFSKLTVFIICLYVFRLVYCYLSYLRNYQWLVPSTDESHIYLLGLRFFTTHDFPNWGPDIYWNKTYLVGGLQGFMVGLPLFIWQHPFSPFLFLYLCLSAGLLYLSWYITRLFPNVPKWLVYCLIALSPFSVHTGLRVINPAYVLCFAIPFMLSYIETLTIFEKQFIKPFWRFFWMGLGILAVFQLHASWVFLFILFWTAIIYLFIKKHTIAYLTKAVIFSGLGMLIGFLPLIHVLYHYGIGVFLNEEKNFQFSWSNISYAGKIIFYFFAQCGYEINSFDNAYRITPVLNYAHIPGAIILGIVQIIGFLIFGSELFVLILKKWKSYLIYYKKFIMLIAGILILLIFTYMFSNVPPRSHANIILYPLSAIYLFWFLNNLFLTTKIKPWFFGVFASVLVTYYIIILGITNTLPDYGYREKAKDAIEKKDASLFETNRFPYPAPVR
jgi:hypothetical protein